MTGQGRYGAGYQVTLVVLLSLTFGIVFFDRNALAFLMPFVQPDLRLTNTQVGLLSSGLSLTWALAGIFIGAASDRTGRRKAFLLVSVVAFSLCSFLSGIAASFLMLLAARLLMGVAEGATMPVSQSLVAAEVSPAHRGVAMGVMQNFGSNLLGSFAAPVLLVLFAELFGWRSAFFLAGVPGLIAALFIWWLIREPERAALPAATGERPSWRQVFAQRNMVLCALISILLVSYLVVTWSFMPLYLTQVRGFSPETMSWLMGTLGISATVTSFVVPGISDRIGRRPVMIVTPFLGVILPLAAMYYGGNTWVLAGAFFVGWALTGTFPMFMATIPSETVPPQFVATAAGLAMGVGELIGGVGSPALAGWIADRTNLSAPLWILLVICILAGFLGFGLRETAPAKAGGH